MNQGSSGRHRRIKVGGEAQLSSRLFEKRNQQGSAQGPCGQKLDGPCLPAYLGPRIDQTDAPLCRQLLHCICARSKQPMGARVFSELVAAAACVTAKACWSPCVATYGASTQTRSAMAWYVATHGASGWSVIAAVASRAFVTGVLPEPKSAWLARSCALLSEDAKNLSLTGIRYAPMRISSYAVMG